ncbi:Protein of unknown function [Cotesia congregata]|uniref:CABIT domain-containing protein n=1 Tax=Cotesia congregata TaxID=51543 RepID=A0A8J2HKZ3_COTCN|nr:Protein of unknown function [Cotesia congregata]
MYILKLLKNSKKKSGWFSVVSGNNAMGSARVYRRIESLVRGGVPAFLLAAPLRSYTLTHSKMEDGNLRAHYTKTIIQAGEVLRLIAVFQDTRKCSSIPFGITGGISEKDQYAQCLDSHGREVFVALSTRGEFYAICQSSNADNGNDAVLYRVHHLAKRALPLRVRLIAGPLPILLPREYGGLMQLEASTKGSIVLGCIVPERPVPNPEMLELVVSGIGAPRVRRAQLGYPSEARLLTSPKMQRLLSACSRAVGDRATEPRVAPQKLHASSISNNSLGDGSKEMHLKKIKPKPETKPVLQSLREGLEQFKKSTVREHIQRSISTSFLETPPVKVELEPNYARVCDSLTPLTIAPQSKVICTKTDDLYTEICETNSNKKIQDFPDNHVIARIKIVVKSSDSVVEDLPIL